MTTREIRFATTSDGVQIGYAVYGEGPLLIAMPDIGFASTLLAERDIPEVAAWAEEASRRFTYVRYDARGFGTSQQGVPDLSLPTWFRDLEGVAADLGATEFALMGWLGSTRVATAYAAANPSRVSRLVTWPADFPVLAAPEGEVLMGLAQNDWETFTETLAHIAAGWENSELAQRLAKFWQQSVSRELYQQFLSQFQWPSMEEAERFGAMLAMPLLVLARRHKYSIARIPVLRDVRASRILILPGDGALPYQGDIHNAIETIFEFVAGPALEQPPHAEPAPLTVELPAAESIFSPRELEVLAQLARGKSNQEIADELVISVRTVERHLMRIYGKIGASGKSARVIAAAHAILSTGTDLAGSTQLLTS